MPASFSAASNGLRQRSSRSSVICSNLARESFNCKCFGPLASAVMYGRLISVSITVESSILAFSAASRKRCNAWRSAAQVNALVFLEFIRGPVDDALIPVIAAEVCITVGGFDFDHAFANFKDGYIKRTTTQVKDQDRFILLLIETISQAQKPSAR